MLESIYKNVVCGKILPKPGSVLKVDLALNPLPSVCHTGIYVGHNRIVEMTNVDGTGIIKKVAPKYFLDFSLWRTGVFIYVACAKREDGKYYPLADPKIAERALAAVGEMTDYHFLLDNCHMFTEYCITGKYDSLLGTLENIEASLIRKFHLPEPEPELVPPQSLLRDILFPKPTYCHMPDEKITVPPSPVQWMSTGVASNDSFPDD